MAAALLVSAALSVGALVPARRGGGRSVSAMCSADFTRDDLVKELDRSVFTKRKTRTENAPERSERCHTKETPSAQAEARTGRSTHMP